MKDQRKSIRIPFSGTIEQLLTYRSDYPRLGGDNEFIGAKALNISSGGLACESRTKIEPLSQVYLIFSVPTPEGSHRIRCEGYVAHSHFDGEHCTLGILFHDLSAEDQSAIDDFIASEIKR
jgi:hypothetical protein